MELLPPTLLHQLPLMIQVVRTANPILYAKLFLPDDFWHFYLCAIDGQGERVYGYGGPCFDPCAECTSYGIAELQRKRGWLGYPVKRDISFISCYLSEVHPYRLFG